MNDSRLPIALEPIGILRNPSWIDWDVTFARRFPVKAINNSAQVRLQPQLYNIFNQVQFTTTAARSPDNTR